MARILRRPRPQEEEKLEVLRVRYLIAPYPINPNYNSLPLRTKELLSQETNCVHKALVWAKEAAKEANWSVRVFDVAKSKFTYEVASTGGVQRLS